MKVVSRNCETRKVERKRREEDVTRGCGGDLTAAVKPRCVVKAREVNHGDQRGFVNVFTSVSENMEWYRCCSGEWRVEVGSTAFEMFQLGGELRWDDDRACLPEAFQSSRRALVINARLLALSLLVSTAAPVKPAQHTLANPITLTLCYLPSSPDIRESTSTPPGIGHFTKPTQ